MSVTKDRLERAATENQFMNGKIKAIEVLVFFSFVSCCLKLTVPSKSYRALLDNSLLEHFPELGPYIKSGLEEPSNSNFKSELIVKSEL